MEIVAHRVNPRTGETVERLFCAPCADEVAGRTATPAAARPVESAPAEIVAALMGQHAVSAWGVFLGNLSTIGNGSKRAFTLQCPLDRMPPFITVNGVEQTVGIRGVDVGKDWYGAVGDAVLMQDTSKPTIAKGAEIRVVYYGRYPIIVSESSR
jgi:hypothetical protein